MSFIIIHYTKIYTHKKKYISHVHKLFETLLTWRLWLRACFTFYCCEHSTLLQDWIKQIRVRAFFSVTSCLLILLSSNNVHSRVWAVEIVSTVIWIWQKLSWIRRAIVGHVNYIVKSYHIILQYKYLISKYSAMFNSKSDWKGHW